MAGGAPALRIDGFEDGDLVSEIQTRWAHYSDEVVEGTSKAAIAVIAEGADQSGHALSLTGSVTADAPFPFVGAAVVLVRNGQPMDVTGFEGLEFYARGDGVPCVVQFVTEAVKDHNYFAYQVSPGKGWKRFRVPISDLEQSPYFGSSVPWTGKDVKAIYFQVMEPGPVRIDLDEVAFY